MESSKSVEISVELFAQAKELAGSKGGKLTVNQTIQFEELTTVISNYFGLEALEKSFILALNEDYLEDSQAVLCLKNNDVVAVIPPLSGG